jgi:putative CocE/NonD family hydrolase
MRRVALAFATFVVLGIQLPAVAAAWEPGPARYGVGTQMNVPIAMADGKVLRANVYIPTEPGSGAPAHGPFPVIMVQTPYGKDMVGTQSGTEGPREAGTQTGPVPYFVKRGYIDVVVDVRGTGASGGTFGLLDPVQGRDGAALVDWAAKLPNASGRVGLYGPSYMAGMQYLTARAVRPGSPLKAIFPIVAPHSFYRELAFSGGMPTAFDLVYDGLLAGLDTFGPFASNRGDGAAAVSAETEHAPALATWHAALAANILTGGDQGYDEDYWRARAPAGTLADLVRKHIPAFLVSGWHDVFQAGGLMNYAALQNLARGRSADAPMTARQHVTGRYQVLYGPWYHLAAGTGVDIYKLELAWFDRWLKGVSTGINRTRRPVHVYELGGGRYVDTDRYPFAAATPTTYFLGGGRSASGALSVNDGALSTAAPPAGSSADQVAFTGASHPCRLETDQFGTGPLQLATEEAGGGSASVCASEERPVELGPSSLTYTTAPFASDKVLAGPIAATIFATSTRPEVELHITISDVAAGRTATPVTSGALLGSHRALDDARTWKDPDGRPLVPFHPYTRAASKPVPTGKVTRFDIEVFPTFARLAKGHRVRLTLTTSDTGHAIPTPGQLLNLLGGVYAVQRNAAAPSSLQLPLAPAEAFEHCFEFTPGAVAAGCPQ